MKQQTPKNRRLHPIHKRIALHTSSLLLVLSAGFMPLPVAQFGDTLTVNARVPAALPTAPAIITSPSDGDHFTTNTITVSGTCPDDSYVKVLRGTEVAGIAICSANAFIMQISIDPGANSLTAKVFNTTDDEGPISPAITVYYDVPSTPGQNPTTPPAPDSPSTPGGSGNTGSTGTGTPGLQAEIPYEYKVHFPGEQWQWELTVGGGTPPYVVTVDWGDGTTSRYDRTTAGPFIISHTYDKAEVYKILITVQDATSLVVLLQLPAPVRDPLNINFGPLQGLEELLGDGNPWLLWPLYIALLLLVVLFWAHEIKALHKHVQRRKVRQHHA